MRLLPPALAFALTLPMATATLAQNLLSEASGNWAGPSNDGFFFRAELSQNGDKARLRIWNWTDASGGDLQFDNPRVSLGAFATRQALEVVDTGQGSILQVVTEFADEEAEGREVVQIQFIDNQFTVVGYYHLSRFYNPGGEPSAYECDVDLRNMVTIDGGQERQLPRVAFEELNASGWTFGAAFERGYCSRG